MAKKEGMTDAQKAKLKKMLMQGGNLDKPKPKKASTSYSPAPMSDAAKAKARIAAAKKQPSLTSKAGKVASKVAGKVAGVAKSKVKADIKAAKTVAGFAAKAAMAPGNAIVKGAKALAKEPRTKRMFVKGDPMKNLINAKKAAKK